MGEAIDERHVRWTIDPTTFGGVGPIASANLRATLFHECHHLVRLWVGGEKIRSGSVMDAVVAEGMATAFERDFTGRVPLWSVYPVDVAGWVSELLALPKSELRFRDRWMYQHPDGRRWIAYRAGTYVVDRARAASHRSAADLVLVPTDAILKLAAVR